MTIAARCALSISMLFSSVLPAGQHLEQSWHWENAETEVMATLWQAADSPPASLIALCPGRGVAASSYSKLVGALVLRGFAVIAVDIPRIGRVTFPNGRSIPPSDDFRPSFELITGPYEAVDEFFEPAVRQGLVAWSLALEKLRETTGMTGPGMTMGAFGHSLGGRICGALVGQDSRFLAYASMEGVPPRNTRRSGMEAASLQMYSSELPEEMALPNIRELFDNAKGPSFLLRLEGFGHNSLTDGPLENPERYAYEIDPMTAMNTLERLLGDFFSKYLGNGEFTPSGFPTVTVKGVRY